MAEITEPKPAPSPSKGPAAGRNNVVDILAAHTGARFWLGALAGTALVAIVSLAIWGSEMAYPWDWNTKVANAVDDGLDWAVTNLDWLFDSIKEWVTRAFVEIVDFLIWLPWPAFVTAVALIAWRIAGWKVAAFSIAGQLFIGLFGLWESAMETMALIVIAVTISIAVALPIGIVAARSDTIDSVARPILDGMQTLPAFVYLVPSIFFFGLGAVPAGFATVIYAVPPAIRLTNLGIRQVPSETVEAAKAFGATSRQLLFKVQIPLAIPTIMAGVNQLIMMALAMVVIASLVGAGGLGEDVLRALGRQEAGKALIGGLSIVMMAIILDRITQGLTSDYGSAEQSS